MSTAPEDFLNRALLRQLAGEHLFASGEQCFALGRVRQVRAAEERVSARVTGDLTYRVKLWRRRGELCFHCDCEAGKADKFCTHCVAVGLAWLSHSEHIEAPAPADQKRGKSLAAKQAEARRERERQRLAVHLKTLDAGRLTALLLEATDFDEILRRRLLLETIGIPRERSARTRRDPAQPGPDFAAYRQMLQEAIRPSGYVDFHAMPDYAQGIEEAIAPLKELFRSGWHAEVIALTEFVLVELDAASDRVDTGDGLLNRVYDQLQHLHLDACREGNPEKAALAARLLHYELEGGLGIFNNAARTYAEILGASGLSAWRTLLVREWQQIVRGRGAAGETHPSGLRPMDHRRFQVQMLTERLARDAGDLDALLAVKRADLHGVHDYVALAEELAGAGRNDDAILCAEKAAARFPAPPEKSAWRGFLLTAYQKASRHEDALKLAWEQFCAGGDPGSWRELKSFALEAGGEAWPEWRDRALRLVREQTQAEQRRADLVPGTPRPDNSRTVELLIEEKLSDAAWQEACAGGCRADLWLRLAGQRANEHPQDALAVYQRHIEWLLTLGTHGDYREVLPLLARVRSLFHQLDRAKDYDRYRADLRSAHRRKRGFLRLLDAPGT